MTIELKKQQLKLLLTYVQINPIHISEEASRTYMTGDIAFFEGLMLKLADIFVEKGYMSDTEEANQLGVEIEGIIDILSIGINTNSH